MEIPTLKGELRKAAGSRAAQRLRRAGKLPGIVYGHQQDPMPITLDEHEVDLLLHHGAHLINLEVEGKVQACLFKDTQYDHLGLKLVHVDLSRVDLTDRVQVRVEIDFRGTPKGVAEGGVFSSMLKELEIECLVTGIPEKVRLDVSDLALDQVLYVKDLKLEPGLTVLNDPESVVAVVRLPVAEAEAPTVEPGAEAASAEPEVIAKGKVAEEGAESAE